MSGTNIQTIFDYFLVMIKIFTIFVPDNEFECKKKAPDMSRAFSF